MTFEKLALPLTVVAAVVGIWAFLRKPDYPQDNMNIGYQGYDPGTFTGHGVGFNEQYIARIPTYGMDPGYIASAVGNPWAQDPNADAAVESQIANGAGSGSIPGYMTYNNPSYGQSPLLNPPTEHAGGSCGCESQCGPDCNSGVSFPDGKGTCLMPENFLPWEPATTLGMTWYG